VPILTGATRVLDNGSMESAIPLAFTASWASGINPYLLVLLMGLIGRFTDWAVPSGLERTDVLVVFAVLAVIDTVADKVMLVDSVWDAINTVIRPLAGAVVAVLIASPSIDLPTAVIAAAGGAVALVTHLAKATTRIAVNTSPEPASNVAVSVVEDVAVAGTVAVAVVNPWAAATIAFALLVSAVVVALVLLRYARRGLGRIASLRASG
jgi:Domain of unknown function (DUF4126)